MRIAFFAVLPPVQSGVADYCRTLLPQLEEYAAIDLFIDDYDPDGVAIPRDRIMHHLRFEKRHRGGDYDAIIYQMGNDVYHGFMYHYILNFPGILVLHDYNIHPSRASMLRAIGDEATYFNELEQCVGPKGREIGRLVMAGDQFGALLETFPMNETILRASQGVVVHNPYVERLVKATAPEAIVRTVNMGIPLPEKLPKKANARRSLNLPLGKFVVAAPGYIGRHRKPGVALEAFAQFSEKHKNALMVFVGKSDPRLDLAGMVKSRGLDASVLVRGYVTAEDFQNYIIASDVVLNLRTNKIRETSATMLEAMALGRPVIATRLMHNCHFPAGISLFVEHAPDEADHLAAVLGHLWSNPKEAEQIGERAREYVRDNHSVEQAALGYKEAIEAVIAQTTKDTKGTKTARTLRERNEWLDEEKRRVLGELCGPASPDLLADEIEAALEQLGLGGLD